MKLTKSDIKKMDKVGVSEKGNDIMHVETKGGLHLMVEKDRGGRLDILASGPHRAIAKSFAGKKRKVQWDQALFKSEDMQSATDSWARRLQKDEAPESTPENHYNLAKWHSSMARQYKKSDGDDKLDSVERHNKNMSYLYHTDNALSHYKASGMDTKGASQEHDKNMTSNERMPERPPFDGYALSLAYGRKTGKRMPSGLGYDFTK